MSHSNNSVEGIFLLFMGTHGINLTIEQKQSLKLSPAQLQIIEILQLSSVALEERVNAELMENPVLEVDERAHEDPVSRLDRFELQHSSDNTGERYNYDSARDQGPAYSDEHSSDYLDDKMRYDQMDVSPSPSSPSYSRETGSPGVADFEKFYTAEETLTDHLMAQLHAVKCPPGVRRACRFVIYSLDENGFVNMTPEELEEASENTAEEFRQALPIVKSFDPAGIAARDLEECLCMQLDPEDELTDDAANVIHRLSDIASGNIRSIMKDLKIPQERVIRIIELIRGLDPKPGARFSSGTSQKYITPDVIADIEGNEVVIRMAGSVPHLILSPYYTDLIKSTSDSEVSSYLKDRIERATQLIRSIESRSNTIINVTRIILERQEDFLSSPSPVLKPLSMQEVADALEIHVSTVSRAVADKYLKCPRGTYSLRSFFTAEVAGGTRDSILGRIRELISAEDPAHPLSDQKIADMLSEEGTEISRRTVAKYRDEAGILPTSQRKRRF